MKRILISTGLLALVSLPAVAADLPVKARPMVPIVTVHNWSGCYIGANGGGKWAQTSGNLSISSTTLSASQTFLFDRATSGSAVLGGQVGCNYQAAGSNWVFGFEGDFDWQRFRATRTLGASVLGGAVLVPGDFFEVRSDWQASARARLGYAWDRWLLYVTGGAAFTNVKVSSNFIATTAGGFLFPASSATDSKTVLGGTIGGGVEYAFNNNWSLGAEGRWSWYGNQTYNGGLVAAVAVPGATVTFINAAAAQSYKLDTFEITGRLNYKF
jgi:outer membrane immunogenic protein